MPLFTPLWAPVLLVFLIINFLKLSQGQNVDLPVWVKTGYCSIWLHHTACGILHPQPWIEPMPPAVGAWSLNHWTTREVPKLDFVVSEAPVSVGCSYFFSCGFIHLPTFLCIFSVSPRFEGGLSVYPQFLCLVAALLGAVGILDVHGLSLWDGHLGLPSPPCELLEALRGDRPLAPC